MLSSFDGIIELVILLQIILSKVPLSTKHWKFWPGVFSLFDHTELSKAEEKCTYVVHFWVKVFICLTQALH